MYLVSNIPYFKCWVRKEFTNGHQGYHGEYLHGLAVLIPSEVSMFTPWTAVVWTAVTMPPTLKPAEMVKRGSMGMVKSKLS